MPNADWWTVALIAASAANVAAMLGLWAMGRENLRLRRELDAVGADRANVSMAANALRETLRKVWADRRHAQSTAAEKEVRLRRVVRRLWKDRRVRQHLDGTARTEGYLLGVGDAARVMERNADARLADARSLAMCDELARYDLGDPGA